MTIKARLGHLELTLPRYDLFADPRCIEMMDALQNVHRYIGTLFDKLGEVFAYYFPREILVEQIVQCGGTGFQNLFLIRFEIVGTI